MMKKMSKKSLSLVKLKENELKKNELRALRGGGDYDNGCCRCGSIFSYFGLGNYTGGACDTWCEEAE